MGEECYLVHTQSAGNTPLYKTEIIELPGGASTCKQGPVGNSDIKPGGERRLGKLWLAYKTLTVKP